MSKEIKTRFWDSETSSTAVQFRDDTTPMIWMHTNIGWVPLNGTPHFPEEASECAESLAKHYGLEEASQEKALYMLGEEE